MYFLNRRQSRCHIAGQAFIIMDNNADYLQWEQYMISGQKGHICTCVLLYEASRVHWIVSIGFGYNYGL